MASSPEMYSDNSQMIQQQVEKLIPRVDVTSNLNEDELKFTLSGVNVSIANSIRRVILSDIPMVVFRVAPNNKNNCNIIANTCGLNNEIVKHRLSCIPIHIKEVEEFPLKNYIMELNVQNNTDTTIYVTSEDFVIKDLVTGKLLPEDKLREIFPANDLTGDFIDFVRLKPKAAEEINGKIINLTCEFDIGTAKEDGAYNVVSTCSYGNTIDDTLQEAKLQQMKQKWKDEGKKEHEIEFEATNWKLLEGKRIFKPNSFDFVIQSIGVYTNAELLQLACKIMLDKLANLSANIEKDNVQIKNAENTLDYSFDIILENEDYTLGKVIEYFMYHDYWEINMYGTRDLTFCGFKMMHPHDNYGIIRIGFMNAITNDAVKGFLKESVNHAIELYNTLQKEFLKLVSK